MIFKRYNNIKFACLLVTGVVVTLFFKWEIQREEPNKIAKCVDNKWMDTLSESISVDTQRDIKKTAEAAASGDIDSGRPYVEVVTTRNWYKYDALNWLAFHPKSQTATQNVSRTEIPSFKKEDISKKYGKLNLGREFTHDKWIILTTIQSPTEDVKFLASLKGWRVIVVGDTKTPPAWIWKNCDFLDVDFQENMGLQLPGIIPYRMYQRKNAGYLYAIVHGAKIIYETDDDNRPTDNLLTFQYTERVSGLMFGGSRLFNAYQYFGQSTLWQRGYPLGKVGAEIDNSFRFSSNWPTPIIQQGVVNGDPDMDGIFRLTRKMTQIPLNVTFDPAAPPIIIPPTVFSPYNTQNTLLREEAFWSLYLPISLNFRTCDIWRGYITQRLLWEIRGFVGFYPPNAYQVRSAHDLMTDTADENQMYFTTEELLNFLLAWRCPEQLSFFQCQYKLMMDLVDAGTVIFGEKDITGVRKWIEDIIMLGYKEPKRVNFKDTHSLKSEILDKGTPVYFAAAEQKDPTISWQPTEDVRPAWKYTIAIQSLCTDITSFSTTFISSREKVQDFFKDVLLIIYYPSSIYSNLKNLEIYYRSLFPNIAYCGRSTDQFWKESKSQGLKSKNTFIEINEELSADHVCTAKALQMNYKVSGFLTIRDDILLVLEAMIGLDKNKVWISSRSSDAMKVVLGGPNGKIAYDNAVKVLTSNALPHSNNVISPDEFLTKQKKFHSTPVAAGSVFYIPKRLSNSAAFYMSYLAQYKVAGEIAVPAVLAGTEDETTFISLAEMNVVKSGASNDIKTVCSMFDDARPVEVKAKEPESKQPQNKNPPK